MDENLPTLPRPIRIIGRIVDDGVVELKIPWPARAAGEAEPAAAEGRDDRTEG